MTHPNFYAIIPAHVRYCKDLELGARMLYGEITALCTKEGYCWASNQYFADLYEVSISTISRWVSSLSKKNFIHLEIKINGTQRQRNIWLSEENKKMFATTQNCVYVPPKMEIRPPENDAYNTTPNITYKKKTPPHTPPEGGGESCDSEVLVIGKFVKLGKKENEDLCRAYGEGVIAQMSAEINDYLASTGKKPYKDYAAAIRQWLRRRNVTPMQQKDDPMVPPPQKAPRITTRGEQDSEWFEKIRKGSKDILNLQKRMTLMYGNGCIEFTEVPEAKFYFGDHGFRAKVENTLRKLEIPISNIEE